jgi:hypothetical protein
MYFCRFATCLAQHVRAVSCASAGDLVLNRSCACQHEALSRGKAAVTVGGLGTVLTAAGSSETGLAEPARFKLVPGVGLHTCTPPTASPLTA